MSFFFIYSQVKINLFKVQFALSCIYREPGWRSRYGNRLLAGRPMGLRSSPSRIKHSLFTPSSRPALGSTQLPIQWIPGYFSPGVKRPGRETDHSSLASAEVKKVWIY
jgi:hypothetical protein